MNIVRRQQAMTQAEFLAWAGAQEGRHEFDSFQPVAMTGGSLNHSRICRNIIVALQRRLEDGPCEALPEAGVVTAGDAVRYPDVLVTCGNAPGTALLAAGVVVVFDVVSSSSFRVDHYVKAREYYAVPSIQRYVIAGKHKRGPDDAHPAGPRRRVGRRDADGRGHAAHAGDRGVGPGG